jgi:predicted nucleic acid-binding protein
MREKGWEKVVPHLDPSLKPYAVDILTIETANALWKYMKRYRAITREQLLGLYKHMMRLVKEEVITLESSQKYLEVALEISINYDIPVYDSLFLAQAKNMGAKIVTSDKKQETVAKKIGLETIYL